jgi:hypothetical protein
MFYSKQSMCSPKSHRREHRPKRRCTDAIFIAICMNAVVRIYNYLYTIWRPKRMRLFASLIKPQPADLLLDVGGHPWFWQNSGVTLKLVETINLTYVEPPPNPYPPVKVRVGDGCALPFADKSYPIVFSNSVIEHVGAWEDQKKFADEARRVGEKLWVQTPAFAFPIEPHCLAPFIHWFPWCIRKYLLPFTPVAFLGSSPRHEFYSIMRATRILTKRELRKLFPDCEIITERFLGIFPKSYIALRTGRATGAGQSPN